MSHSFLYQNNSHLLWIAASVAYVNGVTPFWGCSLEKDQGEKQAQPHDVAIHPRTCDAGGRKLDSSIGYTARPWSQQPHSRLFTQQTALISGDMQYKQVALLLNGPFQIALLHGNFLACPQIHVVENWNWDHQLTFEPQYLPSSLTHSAMQS